MKPFPDREPSARAVRAMADAAANPGDNPQELIEGCVEALKKTTGHRHVEITGSGSEAIFQVLSAVGRELMLPDQGVWAGTPKHCQRLGITTSVLKTDLGIINPEKLREKFEVHHPRALLITSFAGYVAEQDVKEVSLVCRDFGVLLIEDASFSIGDRKLAKGKASDIIVGSARKPKLLNLASGGFISSNNDGFMEKIAGLKTGAADPVICAGMTEELKHAQAELDRLTGLSRRVKSDLDQTVHRERRAPCAGVFMENPKKAVKSAYQKGLVTIKGRSLFTLCPRFDRFIEKGAVLELKKLDAGAVDEAQIEELKAILTEAC